MSTTDLASSAPWLESQRRSRARRFAAVRSLRRRRGFRAGAGVALASLTLATGGALAAGNSSGGAAAGAPPARPSRPSSARSASRPTASSARDAPRRRALPARPRPDRRRRRRPADACRARHPRAQRLDALVVHGAVSGSAATHRSPGSPSASPAATRRRSPPAARYRGKYQFTRATWHSMGGTGDPARASEATQDRLAMALYRAPARRPGRPARPSSSFCRGAGTCRLDRRERSGRHAVGRRRAALSARPAGAARRLCLRMGGELGSRPRCRASAAR